MGRPPSPDKDRFIVRLPDGMRDQINAAAQANNRTMTAEIVARLRWSFEAGQDAYPLNIPVASSVEKRLSTVEQDYVSREEFVDFKLLVEASLKRK
ncbi:Arc family DNA-binding protein [Aminobacter sp. BE322]|uniref:Arc family DNA-binding protein n=1 Tax=unclassified Aminobacter TaxID=2644704 RepID=UPI003D1A7C85